MIWLSDSALRYAADICAEHPQYTIFVFAEHVQHIGDIGMRLRTYVKNKNASWRTNIDSWKATYDNGSRIEIVPVRFSTRSRCNLAIADRRIDQDCIDMIIRPSEVHEPPHEYQTGGHVDGTTWIDSIPDTFAVADAHNAATANAVQTIQADAAHYTVTDFVDELRNRINNIEIRIDNIGGAQPS